MKRVVPFFVVLVGLTLAACNGEAPKSQQLTPAWPKVECPGGSGILAEARLQDIEGWAGLGTPAQVKAKACRTTHTGVTPIHCARVYTAWTAASAAQNPLLTPEQKAVLMAFCVSELTHDSDGSGLAAGGGAAVWPDVECLPLSGVTARARLDQIIVWATDANRLDAKSKAEQCLVHTVDTMLHRFKVYGAWESAKATLNPILSDGERQALWLLCISELTHGEDGGGVGGG